MFAEDAPYFQTTVSHFKSQAEILETLDSFGADDYIVIQGKIAEKIAWVVRFAWEGKSYRLLFTPLPCKDSDNVRKFGQQRRSHAEQAIYQMGRRAFHFVKNLLAAAFEHPHALFGFMEIPGTQGNGGLPLTAGELDVSGLASALPTLQYQLALPDKGTYEWTVEQ